MTEANVTTISEQILNLFENFLSKNCVTLFNIERNEEMDKPECIDPSTVPIIFGEQKRQILSDIECDVSNLKDFDEVAVQIQSREIVNTVYRFVKENCNDAMFILAMKETSDTLTNDVYDIIMNGKA